MITTALPLHAGNAIRIFLTPPAGAKFWRVLRKGSDAFTGESDTSALVAFEGDDSCFVDHESLINDTPAFYRPYYFDGAVWTAGATVMATPAATYEDCSTDAMQVVSERIKAGLAVEVARNNFLTDLGYIQVYTAPPSMERDLRFPLVTVTLDHESSNTRALGELLMDDEFDGEDLYESEGWLAQAQISIIGWSLNPDERRELRKAIRRIVVANLSVFDDHGMQQIDLSMQDSDAVSGEYDAPIYQVVSTFTCLAPVRVGHKADPIIDVQVEGNSYDN